MAYADSGPSRTGPTPPNLPFKPSTSERRWENYDRERGFRGDQPRDSPGRGYYGNRREYPPSRSGPPRARTPSPPRRFGDRGYDVRDRAVDDQWRGPSPAGRPPTRDRDWERDREWRRNDRFRDETRSTPFVDHHRDHCISTHHSTSLGPSPPDRTPRSPPFPPRAGGSRFQARTPPLSTPRVTSGPRSTGSGVPPTREGNGPSRAIDNATPGPGPSTIANSTPSTTTRAPRSLRGSSSPIDIKRLRNEGESPTATSRAITLPSEQKNDGGDMDLEEGEVVSPVKPLIPPWEQRARAYGRSWDRDVDRDRTWDRDRDRGFERPREDDRDRDRWDQNRSYRNTRNSMSPQKRRSRSPYQTSLPPRRIDERSNGVLERSRSTSTPADRYRPVSPNNEKRADDVQTYDEEHSDPYVKRPATPEGPPPDDVKPEIGEHGDALQINIRSDHLNRPPTPLEPPPIEELPVRENEKSNNEESVLETVVAEEAVSKKKLDVSDSKPTSDAFSSVSATPVLQTPTQQSTSPLPQVEAVIPSTESNPPPRPPTPPPQEVAMRSPSPIEQATSVENSKATIMGTEDQVASLPLLETEKQAEEAIPVEESRVMGEDRTSPSMHQGQSSPIQTGLGNVTDDEDVIVAAPDETPFKTPIRAIEPKGLEIRSAAGSDVTEKAIVTVTSALKTVKQAQIGATRIAEKVVGKAVMTETATSKPRAIETKGRAASKTLPVDQTPRVTIAERRAVILPPTSAPLSSPFSDKFGRRDARLTAGSNDAEMDGGPRTDEAEEMPSSDADAEEDGILKLLAAVKAAQEKAVKDPVAAFKVEAPPAVKSSRVDPYLVDTKTRDARIAECVKSLSRKQAGVRHLVHLTIRTELVAQKNKEEALKMEYQALDAEWKTHCEKLDALMQERGPPPIDMYASANPFPLVAPHLTGPSPSTPVEDYSNARTRRRNIGDAVATEADFEAILADLADSAAKDPNVRASKTTAVVPDMLPDHERRMLYDDDNDLVTDPLTFYDFAGTAEPIWTEEERAVFLRRYLQYPKQFGKISDGLEFKTAAQCVAYYYRTKKQIDYKGMLASRRGDKKKKPAAAKSALLADLDRKKPTINASSTPGPRSAIAPARKGDDVVSRRGRQAKESGASTPINEGMPRKKRIEEEENVESSANPSRAGSETPSLAKARMRLAVKGPKRPRVSSVTEVPTLSTIPSETPLEIEPTAAPVPAPVLPGTSVPTTPAELLPPVKRAMKRRKVDPNDQNAILDEKEKDPNKPSRRAATNSYWSVEEKKRFRELVVQFGNDPKLIAAELKGKSERQVSNFFDAHREDMRLEELAKGGESALAELQKQNGPAETPSRPNPFASTPPTTAPYARSIYDVYPGQRRSDAFEPRFAEPRLGMFPPSPHQPTTATADNKPISRPGGMRISALLNDEPAAQDSSPGPNAKSYEADAASDGTVSERDAEGGVKRTSPQTAQAQQQPYTYARVVSGGARPLYEAPGRPSEPFERESFRTSASQPPAHYDSPGSGYYPPPPRPATTAPPARNSWDSHAPRAYPEYPRDSYYQQTPVPARQYPPHPQPIHHPPPMSHHHSHPQVHHPAPHQMPGHHTEVEWRDGPKDGVKQNHLPPVNAPNGQRYEGNHPHPKDDRAGQHPLHRASA